MPLFRQLGQPEDHTYLFATNPDPDRFFLVEEKAAPKAKAAPVPSAASPTTDEVKES